MTQIEYSCAVLLQGKTDTENLKDPPYFEAFRHRRYRVRWATVAERKVAETRRKDAARDYVTPHPKGRRWAALVALLPSGEIVRILTLLSQTLQVREFDDCASRNFFDSYAQSRGELGDLLQRTNQRGAA